MKKDHSKITLGELLSSTNKTLNRCANAILKELQKLQKLKK